MTFVSRQISVTFTMASGNFEGGGNSASLEGLRISAHVDSPGGVAGSTLSIAIYGMPLSMMNQLTTGVGRRLSYIGRNKVTVSANGQLVFTGIIFQAWVDGQAQPNVCFRVEAMPGALANVTPLASTTQPGSQDVAQLMGQLARAAGFRFENNGVNIKLSNPMGFCWRADPAIGASRRHRIYHRKRHARDLDARYGPRRKRALVTANRHGRLPGI
jgi:hypothetical protein